MAAIEGTIVVIGANGGLGSAIARQITDTSSLNKRYHGTFIVRNANTATNLNHILRKAPASFQHDTVSIDLSRLSSVREGAKRINAGVADGSIPPIRALILSAGFLEPTTQTFTEDGYDMTFQVNYLSQFLLVLLLLQSLDRQKGRIVIVGGMSHDTEDIRNDAIGLYKDERWKTLFRHTVSLAKGTWNSQAEDPSFLAGSRRYGAAQLCEIMFMRELQERLNVDPALSNIAVLGFDPGVMPTDLYRRNSFFTRVIARKILMPILCPIFMWLWPNGFMRSSTKSGRDLLRAAFDTKTLGDQPKAAYLNGTDPWPISKEAKDEKKRAMLWRDSISYANVIDGDTVLVHWL